MSIVDGRYRFDVTANQPNNVLAWVKAPTPAVADFYLTVEMRRHSGATDTYGGVIVRKDEREQMYVFRISDNQSYVVSRLLQGSSTRLREAPSSAIRPNQVNRLEVIGQNTNLKFFINGAYVDEIDDPQLPQGQVDFCVFIPRPENAVYEFDNLEVRTP